MKHFHQPGGMKTEGMKALELLVKRAKRGQTVTEEQFDLVDQLRIAEARESFWAFRTYVNPNLLLGWWLYDAAMVMQEWWEKFKRGERPKLVLSAPPQHGKTTTMEDFVAWVSGKDPDIKSIYASYSEELGVATNRQLQRKWSSEAYKRVFPQTVIGDSNVVTMSNRYQRNSSFVEFVDAKGSFRNTTVNGQINGFGLDLGLIDDPMKGRAETMSKTMRDKTWSWFTSDFFARFSDRGGLIMIMTRWHVDDPVGRFIEAFPDVVQKVYTAIAEKDEPHREKGEPLFPEHKSYDFLMERKKVLEQYEWESLYQQHPIIVGGGLFPIAKFKIVDHAPSQNQIAMSVRYWDKAGTADGGAYTVGVLMHMLQNDEGFVISDVRRGQWSAMEREQRMRQVAAIDEDKYGPVEIWVEQEPGSGGKESAERSIMNLRGYICKADRVTGNKEVRASPYAAQVQGGNVHLVKGDWNLAFLDEHETFPSGKYKDQVDAAGGAFAKLAITSSTYDATLSWVG